MTFSQTKKKKSVIFLSEHHVRYISLKKQKKYYQIISYDQADLKPGVIYHHEILEVEFLSNILENIQKKLTVNHIDILLPHAFFLHEKIVLDIPYSNQKKMKKALFSYLSKNIEKYPWVTTHSFETIFYKKQDKVHAHIQMLSQENYRALEHACTKAGFKINAIHSEDFSFAHVFSKTERTLHIRIAHDSARASLFVEGNHVYDYTIDFSYHALLTAMKKYTPDGKKMIIEHGLLPQYSDKKLYSAILNIYRNLSGLVESELNNIDTIQLSFEDYIIPGVVDLLQKNFNKKVFLLDPTHFPQYLMSDVLPIHRDKISLYTSSILYLLTKK